MNYDNWKTTDPTWATLGPIPCECGFCGRKLDTLLDGTPEPCTCEPDLSFDTCDDSGAVSHVVEKEDA